MKRVSLLPAVAVLVLLLVGAGAFLATAPASRIDDLLPCDELLPSLVSESEPKITVTRLCLGPLGDVVRITTLDLLLEWQEADLPSIGPEEPEGP